MSLASDLMPMFPAEQAKALANNFGRAPITAYAAGTVYTLTATSAAVDFGTTDPTVTLPVPGLYELNASGVLRYNGATFAANQTVVLKLRRTNSTATDVTSATTTITTSIITTTTDSAGAFVIPTTFYSTPRSGDIITIFASVSVIPSAGTISVESASIQARKIG